MLISGEYFDYLAPDPRVITLDVLAHGLAVPRFNNQTSRPIHVTEHSNRVRRIVRVLGGNVVAQLRGLLHDSHEALVPWGDCLRPGKTDEMREVEKHVLAAIYEALGLDARALMISEFVHGEDDIVHVADMAACYFEAMLWQPGASDWAPKPDFVDCLLPVIAPVPGECWRSEVEDMLRGGKLIGGRG